ncbi:MAG: hypothetical protein J3Q66DRAFT_276200 [Benniella sp.]|nr:MAG: hypothetical protein J3Q66DRAFT_276200 [Benniella sp.]
MTKRLRTALTKILANLKEQQQQPHGKSRRRRRSSADRYVDLTEDFSDRGEEDKDEDEGRRRRNREPSMMEKFEFCRIHVAEEKIVPVGIDRNYPLHINFLDLNRRVENMQAELKGIIEGTVPSFYLNRALDNYKRMGTIGARNPHVVLANVEQTMPGYYGSKGAAVLSHILAKLFLETNILTRELALPQMPTEYVQHVLVPETGLRLIVEDRTAFTGNDQPPISLDEAREIMMDSVEFGNYIHDIELNS